MNKAEKVKMLTSKLDWLYGELTKKSVLQNLSAPHLFIEIFPIRLGMTSDGIERIRKFVREYNRLHPIWEELAGIIIN